MKSTLIRLGLAGLLVGALAGCGGGSTGATGATGPAGTPGTISPVSANGKVLSAADWQALSPQIPASSISVKITTTPVVTFRVTDQNGYPVLGLSGQSKYTGAVTPTNYNLSFSLAKLVPGTGGNPSKWVSYIVASPVVAGTAGAVVNGNYSWTAGFPSTDTQGTLVETINGVPQPAGTVGDGGYQYTFLRDITQVATIVNGLTDAAPKFKADLDPTNLVYDATATHRLGITVSGSQPGTGAATPTAIPTVNPVPLVNTLNVAYDFVPNGSPVTQSRDIVAKNACTTCHAGKGIGHYSYNSGQSIGEAVPGTCASTGVFTSSNLGYSDFTCIATAYNSSGTKTAWQLYPNGVLPGSFVGRNDPVICVTCHTDQMKYGQAAVTGDGTLVYSGTYGRVNVGVLSDNQAAATFPRLIHQMHMGSHLVKTGYNIAGGGVTPPVATAAAEVNTGAPKWGSNFFYNNNGFSQNQRNCATCHDGSATKLDGSGAASPDVNNWNTVPSQLACGSCHDGINFATGTGVALQDAEADINAGRAVGTTANGHAGTNLAVPTNASCASSGCHTSAEISLYHETANSTPHNLTAQPGVDTLAYSVKSVTVNAAGRPVVTFAITVNGTPVTQLNQIPLVTNGNTGALMADQTHSLMPQFPELLDPVASAQRDGLVDTMTGTSQTMNGLGFTTAFAVPQDGINNPADYNVETGISLTNLLVPPGSSPSAGSLSNTLTNGVYQADATGYFTATLTGDTVGQTKGTGCVAPTAPAKATCVNTAVSVGSLVIPGNASMVTVAMMGGFTQTNLTSLNGIPVPTYVPAHVTDNPVLPKNGGTIGGAGNCTAGTGIASASLTAANCVSDAGGLHVTTQVAKMTATSCLQSGATAACSTPRRLIANVNGCNTCHERLGTNPDFHSGDRNDPQVCAFCHNNGSVRVDAAGWPTDSSTWIHGIHSSSKRTVPFTPASYDYSKILYPGVLKNCTACHLPNTVNFATTGGTAVQPNLLWTYTADGVVAAPVSVSPITGVATGNNATAPWVTAGTNYGTAFTYSAFTGTGIGTQASSTSLVNSPISSACYSCHDDQNTYNHITQTGGGTLHSARGSGTVPNGILNNGNTETCLTCHGQGTAYDAVVIHQTQ